MSGYNPYGSDPTQASQQTPPLDELIRQAIRTASMGLHTWLPGEVVKVYGNALVDVQPLLKVKFLDGTVDSLPVLQRVPVQHPRGATWGIKLPVAVGDTGMVTFCERSLDAWSVSGGLVDPADTRHHSLSDGLFVPGLYPNDDQIEGAETDLIILNDEARITLDATGKFKVEKVGGDELLDLLTDLAEQCSMIQNMGGPTTNAAQFAALKARIEALKG